MSVLTLEQLQKLPPRISQWAKPLYAAQLLIGSDPLDLAAVMDRESRGGDALVPRGCTGFGDGGRGAGLMQLDGGTYPSFFAARFPEGSALLADPNINIYLGARHLAKNLILALREHLAPEARLISLAAYNCGMGRALAHGGKRTGDALIEALDPITTDQNYLSDVLRRRAIFFGIIATGDVA